MTIVVSTTGKTLLNGVNELLKRVSALDSDSGELSTLTDSARQTWIDIAIQAWNEVLDELYSAARVSKPNQLSSSTITLVTDTRAYSPASDVIVFRREYHLYDTTNNHYINLLGNEGYEQIILGDPEEDDTGLPSLAAIRPTDGKIYLNRSPTSDENGNIYTYRYDKDLELTAAADTFPFSNAVFRALIPAASELWKLEMHNSFQQGLFNASIGRAARLLSQIPARESWGPVRGYQDESGTNAPFDP